MADFPSAGGVINQPLTISPTADLLPDMLNMNANLTTFETQTGTWPSANLAVFVPFVNNTFFTVAQIIAAVGTTSGNIDVGVYTIDGVRLVSAGSTVMAASNNVQIFNVTDTVIPPGVYFLAVAVDNTTGIVYHMPTATVNSRAMGVVQMASAFPLPATATFATVGQAYIPEVFATGSATV